ncbi:MAG: hypothetical protein ABR525_05860 [Candidatus Limnocylindria bacterium]
MRPRVARVCSALAAALAIAYGLVFVFGPTGTRCEAAVARPGQPPPTPDRARCYHTSLIQVQGDHLFPALLFIGLWSAAPLAAFLGVWIGGRRTAMTSVVVALIVELSGVVSLGGGFIYAMVVGPLLLLTLFSLRRRPRSAT